MLTVVKRSCYIGGDRQRRTDPVASDLGSVREFLAQHRGEPPRPPKPGRRARPQAARQEREREAVVRSFVESYRARHGRDPAPREVRQATGLPRASAHRWQRRVG